MGFFFPFFFFFTDFLLLKFVKGKFSFLFFSSFESVKLITKYSADLNLMYDILGTYLTLLTLEKHVSDWSGKTEIH